MGKKKQMEYYESLLEKHGPNYLALDWNSPESQKLRADILKEIFIYGRRAAHISLLDVGCGLGDLVGYLKKEHKIEYTGYDISPKMIEAAKKKYPEARFEVRDILEDAKVPEFDYVFASGIFNIRTTDIDTHKAHVRSMLTRMFDLAACGAAVNFLSAGMLPSADPEGENAGRYYYFNPEEVVNWCRHLTNAYILRHDYHPGDFTVYLLK